MRQGLQILGAVALAAGVGLFTLGVARAKVGRDYGDPRALPYPGDVRGTIEAHHEWRAASAAYAERATVVQACGAALAALGAVGLFAPWANARAYRAGVLRPSPGAEPGSSQLPKAA